MTPPLVQLSVVVATYQRGDELKAALASLFDHSSRYAFEVVVVDQSDLMPAHVEALLAQPPSKRFRYVRASPPSLPAARNLGVQLATADLVLFVDDDVALDPGCVDGHIEAHASEEQVACVGGRTRSLDGRPTDELFHLDKYGRNNGEFDYPEAGWLTTARGCNMSFKRSWLERVGGFDSRFVGNAYREETDVCLRIGRAGGLIRYSPSASLLHLEGTTGGCREASAIHDRALAYQNETLFFLRNWPLRWLPILLAVNFGSFVLTRYTVRERLLWMRMRAFLSGVAAGVRQHYRGRPFESQVVYDSGWLGGPGT